VNAIAETMTHQGEAVETPAVANNAKEKVRARAEHISMESGHDEGLTAPKKRPHRKVRVSYALHSKLRGCITELALLDDHFLQVRSTRPDTEPRKYDFDLRFLSPKPQTVRQIAWFWMALGITFTGLATGALWMLWPPSAAYWLAPAPITAVASLLAAAGCAAMFLRRTTESLEFISAHGRVTLVSVTGAIGSARDGKKFFVELIKSIAAAKAARPQNPPVFLRDEMREHHRLRELGALTEEQYEASKSNILASH
jgi:hypothetical protein